jgi:MATE family, multidrug efflux pump
MTRVIYSARARRRHHLCDDGRSPTHARTTVVSTSVAIEDTIGMATSLHTPASGSSLVEGSILRSLLRLAVPIVLANLLRSAYQLIDAFWVGRLGGAAVAAVAVCTPIIFLSSTLGLGLGIACSTLVAQYAGAGNQRMANHVAAQMLLMAMVTSAALGALGCAVAPALLRLMGVQPDVYAGALPYLRISFASLTLAFAFTIVQSVMRGVGQVMLPLVIVLGTVLLNFVLDPLLIFGWGPVPALGVSGAASATFATQTLAASVALPVLRSGRYGTKVEWADFAPDWSLLKRAFALGFPASIEQSGRALGLTLMAYLIATFGTVAIAAYGVGTTVFGFVSTLAMGFSLATATLVGQHIGAGKIERATRIAYLSSTMACITLTAMGLAAFVGAYRIVAFFVPDEPAVIAEASHFLRVIALSFGLTGVQFVLIGVFRAAGHMFVNMTMALVSQFGLQLPLAYSLSRAGLGLDGLWYAFPVATTLTTLFAVAWFMKGGWARSQLVREERIL